MRIDAEANSLHGVGKNKLTVQIRVVNDQGSINESREGQTSVGYNGPQDVESVRMAVVATIVWDRAPWQSHDEPYRKGVVSKLERLFVCWATTPRALQWDGGKEIRGGGLRISTFRYQARFPFDE